MTSTGRLQAPEAPRAPHRALAAIVAVALAAAMLIAAPLAVAATPTPADAELSFLRLMNQTRADHGMAPMKSDALILPIAREWSGAMARAATMSHRPDLQAQVDARVTTQWTRLGENVGRGSGVEALHAKFMGSPTHQANVLGDFNRVGIGVVVSDTTIWVTFDFLKGPDINGSTGAEAGPAYADVVTRGIDHACPEATPLLSLFVDLLATAHAPSIDCVSWWGVASGRTAELFEPSGSVTRAQLASFVARMIEASGRMLPVSPPDAFVDDETSVHELRINQLAALGVVNGKTPGRYAPNALVDRAAMATFLVRAHDVVAARPLATGTDAFGDDNGTTHEGSIDKVAAAGLAGGTSRGVYAPSAGVKRDQMATFLARTIDLLVASGDTPAR